MLFLLSEKYRLELRWAKVIKTNNVVMFNGAYFMGPVLAIADKLSDKDEINLDFCYQYAVLVKNIYTAVFQWEGVLYSDNKINLHKAMLIYKNDFLNVPVLCDTDYIVIDTKNHENEKHYYNMLYPAFVVNKDGILYNFGR